jgi:hypothetical protein
MDTREEEIRSGDQTSVLAKATNRLALSILTARYGLIDDLELDVHFPFVGYAEQEVDFRLGRRQTTNARGIGDVRGTLRYRSGTNKVPGRM